MADDIEIVAAPRGPKWTMRVGIGIITRARETRSTISRRQK